MGFPLLSSRVFVEQAEQRRVAGAVQDEHVWVGSVGTSARPSCCAWVAVLFSLFASIVRFCIPKSIEVAIIVSAVE